MQWLWTWLVHAWARILSGSGDEEEEEPELLLENSGLTAAQISNGRKALRILALEEKQYALERKDVLIFLYTMGLNPTEDVIDSKLRLYRLHDAELFTIGQLAHIWHSLLQDLKDEETILRHAFQFFDKDGNGDISIAELRLTMQELGNLLSAEELQLFLSIMDVDHDGVITYSEFLSTLKASADELSDLSEALPDITPHGGGPPGGNIFRSNRVAAATDEFVTATDHADRRDNQANGWDGRRRDVPGGTSLMSSSSGPGVATTNGTGGTGGTEAEGAARWLSWWPQPGGHKVQPRPADPDPEAPDRSGAATATASGVATAATGVATAVMSPDEVVGGSSLTRVERFSPAGQADSSAAVVEAPAKALASQRASAGSGALFASVVAAAAAAAAAASGGGGAAAGAGADGDQRAVEMAGRPRTAPMSPAAFGDRGQPSPPLQGQGSLPGELLLAAATDVARITSSQSRRRSSAAPPPRIQTDLHSPIQRDTSLRASSALPLSPRTTGHTDATSSTSSVEAPLLAGNSSHHHHNDGGVPRQSLVQNDVTQVSPFAYGRLQSPVVNSDVSRRSFLEDEVEVMRPPSSSRDRYDELNASRRDSQDSSSGGGGAAVLGATRTVSNAREAAAEYGRAIDIGSSSISSAAEITDVLDLRGGPGGSGPPSCSDVGTAPASGTFTGSSASRSTTAGRPAPISRPGSLSRLGSSGGIGTGSSAREDGGAAVACGVQSTARRTSMLAPTQAMTGVQSDERLVV